MRKTKKNKRHKTGQKRCEMTKKGGTKATYSMARPNQAVGTLVTTCCQRRVPTYIKYIEAKGKIGGCPPINK